MARHEPALRRVSEAAAGMSPSAQSALSKMAGRLSLTKVAIDPARFLLAVQTYYAIVVKLTTIGAIEQTGQARSPTNKLLSCEDFEHLEAGGRAADSGGAGFPDAPPWAWYLDLWDRPLEQWLRSLNQALHEIEPVTPRTDPAEGHDLFGNFYMSLFPKQVRHSLGEHYTPAWLADHVLDQVGFDGKTSGRLLDPTCGSGAFLLRALVRLKNTPGACEDLGQFAQRVVGLDVNSLAVLAARANYLLALRDRLDPDKPLAPPIYRRDVILEESSEPAFDFLVGNPPWLAWDHLPDEYRRKTKCLWQRYGLFSLSGNEARHGGGKKDLAMLVLYAGADRYLRHGGRLGMVVTQTLLQTRGAGDGFRRFRLGDDGLPLKVLRVDDLVAVQPFETASNWTATIALQKGTPTTYPVPYLRWKRQAGSKADPQTTERPRLVSQTLEALPVDRKRLQSPWLLRPVDLGVDIDRLAGPSDYTAHLGANTGGANGVYWLRLLGREGSNVEVENLPARGKQILPEVRTLLEPELLYPLVRWSDVGRFQAVPSAFLLLAQDPATRRGIDEPRLQRDFPRIHTYLKRFETQLRRRAAYRRYQESAPFYSMYNVGEYSVAPYKTVWRRMDRVVRAAVLGPSHVPFLGNRPVLCQETCAMIATESAEEAHYLTALLNSSIVGFLVQAHNVCGGKGFGSPGMLEYLRLRQFDAENVDHEELAQLSLAAHQARAGGLDVRVIQQAIDKTTARIYQIDPSQARSLADFVEEPL